MAQLHLLLAILRRLGAAADRCQQLREELDRLGPVTDERPSLGAVLVSVEIVHDMDWNRLSQHPQTGGSRRNTLAAPQSTTRFPFLDSAWKKWLTRRRFGI